MKKVIPLVLIVIGLVAVGFGGYRFITNEQEQDENKTEQKDENNKEESNNEESKKEIEKYLNDKYNEKFTVVKLAKTFCLEDSDTNLYYSEPCTSSKIKNEIYEVKDSNDITFYVKKVSYDESKIKLTREEDIDTQSIGIYDTYISFVKEKELSNSLKEEYEQIFNTDVEVEIYDGIGINNIDYSNAYMGLGKKIQELTDKNISLEDFISKLDSFDTDLEILVTVDEDITKDNFQQIVALLKENDFISKYPNLNINEMIIKFNNENRYIEYDYESFVNLKYGKDVFELNEDLYDKTIILGTGFSSNGIYYDEFQQLDKTTFNF